MKKNTKFHLHKWYLDVAAEDGRTFIGYAAEMTWRGVKVPYVSYLYLRPDGKVESKTRFRKLSIPEIETETVTWKDERFQIFGEWEGAVAPLNAKLHDDEHGHLDWRCHLPAATCRLSFGDEAPFEGQGYVEHLEMTVLPWHLGLDELRWGRYVDPEHPLTWIELRGQPYRKWVFHKNKRVTIARVNDEKVVLPDHGLELSLENPTVIEETSKMHEVVSSLVGHLPGFDRFTPLRFLKAWETKWRSKGRLIQDGSELSSGWVVHELVKF